MTDSDLPHPEPDEQLFGHLQARAKELDTLYRVEEILGLIDEPMEHVYPRIIDAIPSGWQHSEACVARITSGDQSWTSANFVETAWGIHAEITVAASPVGRVSIFYTDLFPDAEEGPFLHSEVRLLKTIAVRIGQRLTHQQVRESVARIGQHTQSAEKHEWHVVLQMLSQTDRGLFLRVVRRMLNHLCWSGIRDAESLLERFARDVARAEDVLRGEWNRPQSLQTMQFSQEIVDEVIRIAGESLPSETLLRLVQRWIQEDKLSYLVQVVNRNLSLSEVADAIRRYHHLADEEGETVSPNKRGIEVTLIRRFLSEQLPFINVARHFIGVRDFYHLLGRVVYTSSSEGRLGGKSAGLYLASQILRKKAERNELLTNVRVPRTWYVASDLLLYFMHYNDFDEVVEQKYKPLNQVRFEYPHIVQTFKNAHFPAEMVNGLSVALDELGDRPLIVRSSSLLEDRIGAAFSGKYRSLFLANQGSKRQRLEALLDAIAEVYASMFGPDPIEYRAERGLIDYNEAMGIMIQEVVGTQVGKYFLPSFAGVAVSNNEFRWSPRIEREDGLVRMVPGLGTRAVDRLSDDYPIMLAPGKPALRVNTDPEEVVRYSPHLLDVLNLETNTFETVELADFLKQGGMDLPGIHNIVSLYRDRHLRVPTAMRGDFDPDQAVVTFEGLFKRTEFCQQVRAILDTLRETLGVPVDLEFASDGKRLYLLQCRPQNLLGMDAPGIIPVNPPHQDVLFTASRHIDNGQIHNISHVVYVDPGSYAALSSREEMVAVGRAVSRLNAVLPRRKFILIGPGRWGSRGDIKLGVSVTYADINNTACLIEVARRQGSYLPDLSFGTHFFQDLAEAGIKYLPLYPDEEGVVFNEAFFLEAPNSLAEVVPEYASLSDVVRLIEISKVTDEKSFDILMNAEQEAAMGLLQKNARGLRPSPTTDTRKTRGDQHWRWRLQMVERMAREVDAEGLGVVNMYLFGSTRVATAGPSSDIDLLIHFRGSSEQLAQLNAWLAGWGQCLSEANYVRTGLNTDNLLDVQIITDADIANRTGGAARLNLDSLRPLTLARQQKPSQQ